MTRYIRTSHGSRNSSFKMRLIIAVGIALFSYVSYLMKSDVNEVTGENQRVALTEQQEIALGLQALPAILQQHQGEHPDQQAQAYVDRVGRRLLDSFNAALAKEGRHNPYRFNFHLLKDNQVVNAFALPGGQIFITAALYNQLETDMKLDTSCLGMVLNRWQNRNSHKVWPARPVWPAEMSAAPAWRR